MIKIKRVSERAEASDGLRFLVDRLWPRGLKKSELKMDGWLKEIAPSNELRKWFAHDPAKWEEFQKRYSAELDRKPAELQRLIEAAESGTVTLLFSAHDTAHNNAVVLKDYLQEHSSLVHG